MLKFVIIVFVFCTNFAWATGTVVHGGDFYVRPKIAVGPFDGHLTLLTPTPDGAKLSRLRVQSQPSRFASYRILSTTRFSLQRAYEALFEANRFGGLNTKNLKSAETLIKGLNTQSLDLSTLRKLHKLNFKFSYFGARTFLVDENSRYVIEVPLAARKVFEASIGFSESRP